MFKKNLIAFIIITFAFTGSAVASTNTPADAVESTSITLTTTGSADCGAAGVNTTLDLTGCGSMNSIIMKG